MKNEMDLKSLWNAPQTPVPSVSDIRKKAKRFRLRGLIEVWITISLLVAALLFGWVIWICWTPQFLITHIGMVLLTIGFTIPSVANGKRLYLYYHLREDCTSTDYINQLLRIKEVERKQQYLVINLYFLFLSLGFGLYMYEYTFPVSIIHGSISYFLFFIWIALNRFLFRPYIIRKWEERYSEFLHYIRKFKEEFPL